MIFLACFLAGFMIGAAGIFFLALWRVKRERGKVQKRQPLFIQLKWAGDGPDAIFQAGGKKYMLRYLGDGADETKN